jgi:hypothetical protein
MARTSPKPVRTLYRGTNADLLVDVARLYIPDGALVADVCWGRGVFWQKTDASRFTLLGSDVDPARISAAAGAGTPQWQLMTVPGPTFLVADCGHLPYRDRSLDALILDPPYMHRAGYFRARDFYNTQWTAGKTHLQVVRDLYCPAILEAARVLRPGGHLFVKAKDEIERGRQCYARDEIPRAATRCGFRDQDMFLYEAQTGPTLLTWDGHAPQKHARKNHSYLFCFVLPTSPVLAARGRPVKGSATATFKGDRGKGYLAARLMRDHPAVYARYMAGELASVHAAAQVAGLVTTKKGR